MTNAIAQTRETFSRQSLTRFDCVRVRSHQRKQEKEGNEDDEEEHV
jgi:hypothetical protein